MCITLLGFKWAAVHRK